MRKIARVHTDRLRRVAVNAFMDVVVSTGCDSFADVLGSVCRSRKAMKASTNTRTVIPTLVV